ncbi:Uncharacterized protein CT_538 [Chlamydiales bacterium SCGC AG-110-P3]|nr:Uncharacterized protein CT_538 [Chlamydiales bacterium SCGC AG-110-P3]
MTQAITDKLRRALFKYVEDHESPELVETYMYYVEKKNALVPVLFPRERKVYRSAEEAIRVLDAAGKLCHETAIKINFGEPDVNELTRKVYICPFTGKVFGDNTHPNPQDAIYDWVSKCPENTERVNGLRVKRFFISEDPEMIKGYIPKEKPKEPISKVVFTSALSGKLFNDRKTVIEDFRKHYLKKIPLAEVQSQERFDIEEGFTEFLQKQLDENKIAAFVESLAEHEEFLPYIQRWLEGDEEEGEEELEVEEELELELVEDELDAGIEEEV